MNNSLMPGAKLIWNRAGDPVRVTILEQFPSAEMPQQYIDPVNAHPHSWPSPVGGPPTYRVRIDEGKNKGQEDIAESSDLEPIST